MKKLIFLALITSLYLNSPVFSSTELLMRIQDDETEEGIKIRVSIPKVIYDGPAGDGIEIITDDAHKAIVDNNGNFLEYHVDREDNIAPKVVLREFRSLTGQWPPTEAQVIFTKGRKKEESKLPVSNLSWIGLNYISIDGKFTSDVNQYNGYYNFPLKLKDRDGNPIILKTVDKMPFFGSVSTFAAVWSVLNMYEKGLESIRQPNVLKRRGNLSVFPNMTRNQFRDLYPTENYEKFIRNAFYDFRPNNKNKEHVLCFFPIEEGSEAFTSCSSDVVFHETGHYALNILRPDLWASNLRDVSAFHETFGDMTALFTVLSFAELNDRILKKTKGNLHVSSFLSVIGEGVVDRDASQCTTLSITPSCEQHDLSQRLTRALYGTFADYFNALRREPAIPLSTLLMQTANDFKQSFLKATLTSKLSSFIEFGRDLRKEGEPLFQTLVHTNFLRQGIDLTDTLLSQQACRYSGYGNPGTIGCSTEKISKGKKKGYRVSSLSRREHSLHY